MAAVLSSLLAMLCLGIVLFMIASTVVLSLIPTYLSGPSWSGPVSIFSSPQTKKVALSPNSGVNNGDQLSGNPLAQVQSQMSATVANSAAKPKGYSGLVVNQASGSSSSKRKRRQNSDPATDLIVTFIIQFSNFCSSKKCQARVLQSIDIIFSQVSILLGNSTASDTSDDQVTSDINVISQYWGYLRPYADNDPAYFGVLDTGLPDGCQVEQVHILHRHSSRYPANSPTEGAAAADIGAKLTQLISNGNRFSELLSFLNTWSYRIGADLLLPSGAGTAYQSGIDFWNRYGRILYNAAPGQAYYSPGPVTPFFRSSSVPRVAQTTLDWAAGFFGPYNTTNKYNLTIIPAALGANNSLVGQISCNNSLPLSASASGRPYTANFISQYLANATARISSSWPAGITLTAFDVFSMQLLCCFEYAALGSSDFCTLFTPNEWKGFEHVFNNIFYKSFSYGNPSGRAQGVGYVQELIARLTNQYITVSQSSVNSTLDSVEATFPLNRPFYFDGSHDNNMVSVLTALSIGYFRESVSLAYPIPTNFNFHVSHMTPFAARLLTEKIGCISSSPTATNSTRTQYSATQYGYSAAQATNKFIRIRLNNGILPLDTIQGGQCSIGRTDGLCPFNLFLASQANASTKANYQYACFGKYTTNTSTIADDGTIFA